jgi:Immunoglobulin I-set domain
VILRLGVLLSLVALLGMSACPPAAPPPGAPGATVAPIITQQPANQTVTVGQTATFSVVATGTTPLSYQWQKNGSAILNAPNSPNYTTPVLAFGDSGTTFQVVVSNGVNPSATSASATLTVNPASVAPSITTQPANATVTIGATATFSVVAAGTAPLSYQWQKNNSAITNAPNSPSYTTPVLAAGDSGSTFRVVVSNGVNPPATSNSATLTVNSPPAAPSITTQPADVTVTAGATATFSVVAAGTAPLSYQWERNNSAITNAPNSASYTTPVLTTADSGATFQVIVSNSVSPPATSNSATLTVNPAAPPPPSTASVLTYHNDNGRTGLNPNETILTTTNVKSATFGKLGTLAVTGLVDAQPLYVPGLTINGAIHNVVYVVTEHDMVYAFDADTPGTALWQISAIPSTEASSDDRGCGQVTPEIGITSTPVIDLHAGPNGTIFLVTMSKDSSNNYHHRLHALDLITHLELNGGPTEVQATFPGTGTGNSNGTQTFNAASYEERAALLLLNGAIYTTWTSHCDAPNYTSWVISYSETTLQRLSVLNLTANGTTQNGQEGGIWMAGDGPAADASGFIYFLIGNGTFDTTLTNGFPMNSDYGNSFMKLSTTGSNLAVADYFAMNNLQGTAESESSGDTDLGSGGEIVLPDVTDNQKNVHHLSIGAGKDTNMYIVNRDNMGKFAANDSGIYQELSGALGGGSRSTPAYFNSTVYYDSTGSQLTAFPISNAMLAQTPSSLSSNSYGYPGATPSISANGTANGIVWTLEAGSTGILRAFDASNLATELYDSNQAGTRDQFSDSSNDKFVTPMIANGKVYVGTSGAVVVFGLNP